MTQSLTSYHDLQLATQDLQQWCLQLQTKAILTTEQRGDLDAIAEAVDKLALHVDLHLTTLQPHAAADAQELQRIRHELRNHLNIVIGFTRFWLRELPDNLLLHMETIRKMNATSLDLLEQINAIR